MNGIKFAERIRELRLSKNMTMEELGDKLGKTKSTISTWEKGTRSPKMGEISDIADFFGVSGMYLLGFENSRGVSYGSNSKDKSSFSLFIAKEISELPFDTFSKAQKEQLQENLISISSAIYESFLEKIEDKLLDFETDHDL